MTSSGDNPWDDVPEADLAEQHTPINDPGDEEGLDVTRLAAASVTDADPADMIDQSFTVALPAEDEQRQR